jgi:hypothetical protein
MFVNKQGGKIMNDNKKEIRKIKRQI